MSSTPIEPDPTSTQTFGAIDVTVEPEATATGPSQQDRAAIAALPPGTALLIVQHGPTTGARFLLDSAETTVGRHPHADIFLDDVTVSRKHAVFQADGESFVVRDVGSLNGTYVNRELVDHISLRTGDEVQIGKFRMVFYANGSGQA